MPKAPIDAALAQLTRQPADATTRRDTLDRFGHLCLDRPGLAGQALARLMAEQSGAPRFTALGELIGAALHWGRLERENGKRRGVRLLEALGDAVRLAAGQRRLGPEHRLALARLWSENGLAAPESLAFTTEELDRLDAAESMPEAADEPEAAFERLVGELVGNIGDGDAPPLSELHEMFATSLATLPAEMRAALIAHIVSRPEPALAGLAGYWLLDPAADLRLACARALLTRAEAGALLAPVAASLATLRGWMPEGEARKLVDQALRARMRAGDAGGATAAAPAWTVETVLASLPDGGGAQGISIALRAGRKRQLAMVLLKQGQGVKDAQLYPCASAAEQKAMLREVASAAGGLAVPLAWLERRLAAALAEGLAAGVPPAAGLIEVAQLCGWPALRPAAAAPAGGPQGLTATARAALLRTGGDWGQRHPAAQSWFENSDSIHDLLDRHDGARAQAKALWPALEARRDWWTRLIGCAADTLAAAGHRDADALGATAQALADGTELATIPLMKRVHAETIAAWQAERAGDEAGGLDDDEPQAPAPERRGELAKLLKASPVSADWFDGFALAVWLAPRRVPVDRAMTDALNEMVTGLKHETLQRVVELLSLRLIAAPVMAADADRLVASLVARKPAARRDWARGFSHAVENYRRAWPASRLKPTDRAMLRTIADGARDPFDDSGLRLVGQWVAAR